MYGVNPTTGFALRPFDNVGVQYGLGALNAGIITTTQFLNLNEKIGGYDQDANYIANRVVGDPGAIKRAQQNREFRALRPRLVLGHVVLGRGVEKRLHLVLHGRDPVGDFHPLGAVPLLHVGGVVAVVVGAGHL